MGLSRTFCGWLLIVQSVIVLSIQSQGSDRSDQLWEQMSDIEKLNRLKDLQRRIFFEIQNKGGAQGGGGGSGYGAPAQKPSYNAPAPSYNAPAPSYNAPAPQKPSYKPPAPRPSYNQPAKPSYNQPAKPSYNGGGKGSKILEIPLPDIALPNPLDFKAGVIRSKGRIASGLLHSKAGLLRAGANFLVGKANTLDNLAETIPGIGANFINGMKAMMGDGAYGAPPAPGYGAPPAPGYGAPPPQSGYNAPQGPPATTLRPNFNNNNGGGSNNFNSVPAPAFNNNNNNQLGNSFSGGNSNQGSFSSNNAIAPVSSYSTGNNNNNFGNSGSNAVAPVSSYSTGNNNNFLSNGNSFSGNSVSSGSSFNSGNSGNSFNSGNSGNSFNSGNSGNSFSGNNGNNFNPSNLDTYGNPTGNVLSNADNFGGNPRGNTADISVGSSLTFGNNNLGNSGNSAPIATSLNTFADATDAGLLDDFSPLIESTLEQINTNSVRSVRPSQNSLSNLKNEIQNLRSQQLQEARTLAGLNTCDAESESLSTLLADIFMGNEVIPDVIDHPPMYPLDLTYKTIRTFPGMRLTADMTRFKPMLKWPAHPDSLYTIVVSNLDINSRRNRTLSEFWHWFVANIPGDSVDDGEVIFDLLFPLVLPEGNGDHRYGYFVFEQPRALDYREEGGPTDACSPQMSNGRGPFKSTKNFMRKYGLKLTAATFIILDSNEASMEIACEWQRCIGNTINLVSPLQCNN